MSGYTGILEIIEYHKTKFKKEYDESIWGCTLSFEDYLCLGFGLMKDRIEDLEDALKESKMPPKENDNGSIVIVSNFGEYRHRQIAIAIKNSEGRGN